MVNRNEYRRRLDAVSNYMHKFRVPSLVQVLCTIPCRVTYNYTVPYYKDRVKLWMQFTWEQQKSFDENKVLSFLPTKVEANFESCITLNNDVMLI